MRILVETDFMLTVMEEYIQDISLSYLKHLQADNKIATGVNYLKG